jgi:4-oxalocrotonate tautomerase
MPLIEIHMLRGRTDDQKRKLLDAVTHAVSEAIDAPLPSIRVWIHEFGAEEYMVAGRLRSDVEHPD